MVPMLEHDSRKEEVELHHNFRAMLRAFECPHLMVPMLEHNMNKEKVELHHIFRAMLRASECP